MATGAIIARIISQYSDKGTKAAQKDIAKLGKSFDQFAKKAAIAFAAVGVVAIKVGKDAVQAAIDDQKSQVLLANSLRNTVNATEATIASTENYITLLQKQVRVADDELRPAYGRLVAATGSIVGVQQLLSTALNVSAQSGADLASSSDAIIKATKGQYKSLGLLVPGLSAATIKTKDFNKVLKETDKVTMGAAARRAGTLEYQLIGLKIAYGEILETLGYALLPVISDFADVITNKVLPVLEAWINANKDKLAKGLDTLLTQVPNLVIALFGFFDYIQRNLKTLEVLGAILFNIFVTTKVYAGITVLTGAISALSIAFGIQTASATAAATATALATAGASVAMATVALATIKALTSQTAAVQATTTATDNLAAANARVRDSYDISVKPIKTAYDFTKLNVKLTAKQLKAKQDEIKAEKALALLKAMGIVPTTDAALVAIQLEAVRLNLVKQGTLAEMNRLDEMLASYKAQLNTNEAMQRYADLLGVIADNQVSPNEVAVLAAKWGLSKDAVVAYISTVLLIGDAVISDAEIVKFAKQWGITKDQAGLYLDVSKAIADSKLSDAEVVALATKWNLTNEQVLKYAEQIAKGVAPNALWAADGNAATKSWQDALKALNDYLNALGKKTEVVTPKLNAIPAGAINPQEIFTDEAIGKDFKIPLTLSQQKYQTKITAERMQGQADAYFAANPNIDPKTGVPRLAAGGIVTSATMAMIGEAGPEAVIPLSKMGGMGTTVNITVNGSVTSASDLTETVRNGILRGQVSGRGITTRVLDL